MFETVAGCGALLAICVLIYQPVAHFGFVNWDDATYVLDNPHVLGGLSWANLWWAFATGHAPYWHPVTWLSHMADVSLFGVDPGAYHLVSLALHAFNSVALFLWWRSATNAPGRSLLLAALFAAHPVQVESVAWIAERKEVLSTALLLLSLAAYLTYVRRGGWARYTAMLSAFCLALMTKPIVVVYPILLLALDFWPLGRAAGRVTDWKPLVREKLPLFLAALVTGAVTVLVQTGVGALPGMGRLSWTGRVSNVIVGYPRYLRMTLWPTSLAAYYPLVSWSFPVVLLAGGLLIAVTAVCLRIVRRYPFLLVGWAWFIVALIPVSGVIQSGGQAVADRFLYLPIVGLLVVGVWGAASLSVRASVWVRRGVTVTGVMLVLTAGVLARVQVMTWSSSESLWAHDLAVADPSARAYENLAQTLREQGEFDRAVEAYRQALALPVGPGDASSAANLRNSLGLTLVRAGRLPAAEIEFEQAAKLDPTFGEAALNLGNALAGLGEFDRAAGEFQRAIRLMPGVAAAHVGLANVSLERGRTDEAVREYREAVRLDPHSAQAHKGLAGGLVATGDLPAADAEYRTSIQLDPQLATTHLGLGLVLLKEGARAEGKQELEDALRLDPNLAAARTALGGIRAPAR